MDTASARRYAKNYRAEIDGAFLYGCLASMEVDERLAEVYRRLAATEDRHTAFWAERLAAVGAKPPPKKVSLRARALAWAAKHFGPGAILAALGREERQTTASYQSQPEAAGTALPEDEHSHARVLSFLSGTGGLRGQSIARFESRHRAVGGNALRAAVLGANDGLVSNLSLVMGVAGATSSGSGVLIAGLSGLLAGGLSMSLGEWLSVQSSRELHQAQIAAEAEELAAAPQEEAEELALIYQAKGLSEDMATEMAQSIMADPRAALDTLAREELGVDPQTLGGSAWEAAIASFMLFVAGAIVPVFPFIFARGTAATIASVAASGVVLFLVGAIITIITGISAWRSGLRQLLFGLAAAGITYGLGTALGGVVGG